jgi:hypothetical protein
MIERREESNYFVDIDYSTTADSIHAVSALLDLISAV